MTNSNTENDHYAAVGKIAANWALLEASVDLTLWEMTSYKDEASACITAQLMGLGPRLNALSALLHYFDCSTKLRETLESFSKKTVGANEQRNRAIHDPWLKNKDNNELRKIRVTAKKALTFKSVIVTVPELEHLNEIIILLVNEYQELQKKIIVEWLAASPEKRGEPPP